MIIIIILYVFKITIIHADMTASFYYILKIKDLQKKQDIINLYNDISDIILKLDKEGLKKEYGR